jgi:AcrR family transcriptional regulator
VAAVAPSTSGDATHSSGADRPGPRGLGYLGPDAKEEIVSAADTHASSRVPTARLAGDVRRQQIRDVAAGLFDRLGYRETSMDKIAEAVGIRKASLYYYFPSKDRLLVEMHEEMIEAVISSYEARRTEGGTASAMILGMMTDLVSLQDTHPGSMRVFFEHYRELPGPERERVLERRSTYESYLRTQLQRGVDEGEFVDLDVPLTAFAILGMTNWVYQWFRPDGRASAEHVARVFWGMIARGIEPR